MQTQYTTNEKGERVIAGTRRPDGSLRKERRVKEGYVPVDEQEAYAPQAAKNMRGGPKVVGIADSELDTLKKDNLSKAAKKNQRRKAKKATEGSEGAAEGVASLSVSEPASAPAPAEARQQPSPAAGSDERPCAAPAPAAATGGGEAGAGSELSEDQRQLRALQKKLRQCEALLEKQGAGAALTGPEADKLARRAEWRQEAKRLEES